MLKFVKAFKAAMALETPQVALTWELEDSLPHEIEEISVRKALDDYPETIADGVEVFSTADVTVEGHGDTEVDPDTNYFYSLFIKYLENPSEAKLFEAPVRRLGWQIVGLRQASASPRKVWVLAETEEGAGVLWLFNHTDGLAEEKYDLTALLAGERVRGLAFAGSWGGDEIVAFVTNRRYIEFTRTADQDPTVDDVVTEWEIADGFKSSGRVTGALWQLNFAGNALDYILILDSENRELHHYEQSGNRFVTLDLTNLTSIDLLGADEEVYGPVFDPAGDAVSPYIGIVYGHRAIFWVANYNDPDDEDIKKVLYVRENIDYAAYLGSSGLYVVQDGTDTLVLFQDDGATRMFGRSEWTSRYDTDAQTRYLVHFEEAGPAFVDSAWKTRDITSSGVSKTSGRFGTCVRIPQGAYVDLSEEPDFPIGGGGAATVELWVRALAGSYWVEAGPRYILSIRGDADNRVEISVDAGQLSFTTVLSGTTKTVTVASPTDAEFHHLAIYFDGVITQTFKAYLDHMLVGTANATSFWGAGQPSIYLGTDLPLNGDPALRLTFIGDYDEFRISTIAGTLQDLEESRAIPISAEARSGRSYAREVFSFRDHLFSRFLPEVLRDSDIHNQILPPNQVLESGEVVNRDSYEDGTERLLPIGQTERLLTFLGLLLDRSRDRIRGLTRDVHTYPHTRDTHSTYACLDTYAQVMYADRSYLILSDSLVNPETLKRVHMRARARVRFIRNSWLLFSRKGTKDSLQRLLKLFGYFATFEEAFGRRRWDSCRDPERDDVPLDSSLWGMDSGHETRPLAKVALAIFRLASPRTQGSNGVTSVPANREFTSAGQTFLTTVRVGDGLQIDDPGAGDNGEYKVISVTNDTTLVLDRDWPIGSLVDLSYSIHTRMPEVDPATQFLFGLLLGLMPWTAELLHATT